MLGITNKIRRAAIVMALAAAVSALVVPSAAANGNDGDRATSKPLYGPVDGWYSYAVSLGNRGPEPAPVATAPDGFAWGDFGIGAAAMFGATLLLAGLAVRVRGTRAAQVLRST